MSVLLSKDGYFKEIKPVWVNGKINGYYKDGYLIKGNWVKSSYVAKKTPMFIYHIYINKSFEEINRYVHGFDIKLKDVKGDIIIIKKKINSDYPENFKIKELMKFYDIYKPVMCITPNSFNFGLKAIPLEYFYDSNNEKIKFKREIDIKYFKELNKHYDIRKKSKWMIFKHKKKSIKYLMSF